MHFSLFRDMENAQRDSTLRWGTSSFLTAKLIWTTMQESSFYMLLMNSSLVLFWTPSGQDLLASSPLKQTLHQPVKSNGTSLIAIHQASLTPHGSLRGLMKYFISGDDYTWVQHFSQMHKREINFYSKIRCLPLGIWASVLVICAKLCSEWKNLHYLCLGHDVSGPNYLLC